MTKRTLHLAVAQMTSVASVNENIKIAEKIITQARLAGVDLVCFPECSNLMQKNPKKAIYEVSSERNDSFLAFCRQKAADYGLWIHLGSLALQDPGSKKFSNRTIILDNTGNIVSRYNKIHLFDVDIADGQVHRESDCYRPGDQAVLADTPWGKWGLSICYDLRFPHLYRALAHAGASILFVPAAFTVPTGTMHWEALLKSRAIENGCFVVATAQTGKHEDGRETYGHSMIVSPWGEIIVAAGSEPSIFTAELDLSKVAETRCQIPSLANERKFSADF